MKFLAWLPALLAAGCIGLEPLISDSGGSPPVDDTAPEVLDYGDLRVEPASVDFGQVNIGSTGEATVVVSYDGSGDTIVSEAAISGGGGTMVLTSMTSLPVALDGDNQAVFELLFSPSSDRDYYGELLITTDHHDAGEITVPLDGLGFDDGSGGDGPDITVSPSSVDFGLIDVGAAESRTLTVSNIGTESFFLLDIETSPPTLTYDFGEYMPLEFDPGESREVTVEWTPANIGTLAGEVVFVSDVPSEERLVVPATGEADDICSICAPMISVDTGGAAYAMEFMDLIGPDTQTVTITNSGDQTLTVRDVYVNNDLIWTYGTFTTNWSGSSVTIEPWRAHQLNVTFTATGYALDMPSVPFDMNILHIISDAINEGDYAIELTGVGV